MCLTTQEVNKKIRKNRRIIMFLYNIFVGFKQHLSHECFQTTLLVLQKTHLLIDTGEINEFFMQLFNEEWKLHKICTSIVHLLRDV